MATTDVKTRSNIVLAKQRGEKGAVITSWLNVSQSTVDKIWRRFRETGSYLATPCTGRKSTITEEQDEVIRDKIKDLPDITLDGILEEIPLPLCSSGLWRKLNRMGLAYKKNAIPQSTKPSRCTKKTQRMETNDAGFRYKQTYFSG